MDNDQVLQSRRLLLNSDYGMLATHSSDNPGFPFGSLVPLAFDDHYRPLVQISRLAQHTRNIQANPLLSVLVSSVAQVGLADVQSCARVTLLAEAKRLTDDAAIKRYCRYYPHAAHYQRELDFDFYLLDPLKVRFIGGFGQIHWVDPEAVFCANPFSAEDEFHIVAHMNNDHRAALHQYCHQAGIELPSGVEPGMVGVDAFGFHLRIDSRVRRFEFNASVQNVAQVRKALIAKLQELQEPQG